MLWGDMPILSSMYIIDSGVVSRSLMCVEGYEITMVLSIKVLCMHYMLF